MRTRSLPALATTRPMGLCTSPAAESVVPTAVAHGITTEERAAATLSDVARDAERFPARPAMWPLLIGAWKHKPDFGSNGHAR